MCTVGRGDVVDALRPERLRARGARGVVQSTLSACARRSWDLGAGGEEKNQGALERKCLYKAKRDLLAIQLQTNAGCDRVVRRRRSGLRAPTPQPQAAICVSFFTRISVVSSPIWTIVSPNDSHRSRGFPEHSPSSLASRLVSTTLKNQRNYKSRPVVGRWRARG